MSRMDIRGVVFDVDGVLFDTERLAYRCWQEVGARMGWSAPGEHYLEFVGRNRADTRTLLKALCGPDFPVEEFLAACSQQAQARVEQEGVPLKPGVEALLSFLRARGVPLALATSTSRERTVYRMERTGLGRFFSAMATGDQVAHSKPHPEIYQRACAALELPPEHTLAIEDSANGIRAAHAAGMPVIMVPDMVPPTPELDRLLWRRCASLDEVRVLLSHTLA